MTTTPTASPELPDLDRQFRKKPVVIEAIQWTGKLACLDAFNVPELHQSLASNKVGIPTLEGTMIASVGDWIIKGVKGEFYPCKPDIFAATYEPAARRAQPEGEDRCVICGSTEPRTGTCGSDDPRALCKAPAGKPEGEAPQAELVELLRAIRPNYGDVGSRDIDVTSQRKRIDRAIKLLSAPAATLSPLCGAQHAESGKEEYQVFSHDSGEWYVVDKAQYDRAHDSCRRVLAAQQAAAPGALYSYMGESGRYELLGYAVGAGKCKLVEPLAIYRDTATGNLYFRAPADFAERMEPIEDNTPEFGGIKTSAPGTPEAPKDERKGIELWRATLRACGELPEGYEVRIELENGCGMAVWYDAEGERHVIDGEGYLSDDLNEAVDLAIQRAAAPKGGA